MSTTSTAERRTRERWGRGRGRRALARGGEACALLLLGLLACSLTEPESRVGPELEAARELWRAQDLTDYAFEYRLTCFCGGPGVPPVRIEVVDGEVTAVTLLDGGQAPFEPGEYPTVDELFDRIEEQLARDPFRVLRLEFHPETGHPTDVFIDFHENVADEEWGFRTSEVEPLGP